MLWSTTPVHFKVATVLEQERVTKGLGYFEDLLEKIGLELDFGCNSDFVAQPRDAAIGGAD